MKRCISGLPDKSGDTDFVRTPLAQFNLLSIPFQRHSMKLG
jgi:hypothetical protein